MTTLYERDFYAWALCTRAALSCKDWDKLDLKNLIDEVDGLVRGETSAAVSSMRLIFSHLLKWIYQPEKRTASWLGTIERERQNLEYMLEESPSLAREQESLFQLAYKRARKEASRETGLNIKLFPESPRFSYQDALAENWLPEEG